MNKVKLNFAIDALMFPCMMAIAGLGFERVAHEE
jgi:hypothetical protein